MPPPALAFGVDRAELDLLDPLPVVALATAGGGALSDRCCASGGGWTAGETPLPLTGPGLSELAGLGWKSTGKQINFILTTIKTSAYHVSFQLRQIGVMVLQVIGRGTLRVIPEDIYGII